MTESDHTSLNLAETGRDAATGKPVHLDRRLYMQFLAYGGCRDEDAVREHLAASGVECVLYRDLNDPVGIGLLFVHEIPDFFVGELRALLGSGPFPGLQWKPEFTMFGRTYSIGYETDLEEVLLNRPRHRVQTIAWPWAVWYPLRRAGSFAQLDELEQREMLMEHGRLGSAFGEGGHARDIRLACHGLDKNDNDFVIGLIGAELHPLSALVQAMRKTRQTSQHLASLGPFFTGKVFWQSHPAG